MDDRSRVLIELAVEIGYRGCEQGRSLLQVQADMAHAIGEKKYDPDLDSTRHPEIDESLDQAESETIVDK